MFYCDLFNLEEFTRFNFLELAEWIIKCRQFISRINYDTDEDYQNEVFLFCEEWEEHYKQNENVYKSDRFKKAILFIGRKDKISFVIDFGNGQEDIIEFFSNMHSTVFKKEVEKKEFKVLNDDLDYYNKILKICFDGKKEFKTNLGKIISEFYFQRHTHQIRAFRDGKWFRTSTFKEFLDECEKVENYVIVTERKKQYESYFKALEAYDIPSTIYNDYMSMAKAEKAFDKKIFVNLAFALSLPYAYAKILLRYNGFSVTDSIRKFDEVCEKAFRIGYGRDYFIALIDKYNADMKKVIPNFIEVQNITKGKRKSKNS